MDEGEIRRRGRRTSEVVGELLLSICVAGGWKRLCEVVEVEGFHGERRKANSVDEEDGDVDKGFRTKTPSQSECYISLFRRSK